VKMRQGDQLFGRGVAFSGVQRLQPVRRMRTGFLATFWPDKKVSDGYSRFQRAPRSETQGRALGRARISQSCTWARPPKNPHPWRSLFLLSRVRLYSASVCKPAVLVLRWLRCSRCLRSGRCCCPFFQGWGF
jgi:hypothetical protein